MSVRMFCFWGRVKKCGVVGILGRSDAAQQGGSVSCDHVAAPGDGRTSAVFWLRAKAAHADLKLFVGGGFNCIAA